MTSLPVGVEYGQEIIIQGPDGTYASFNNPASPYYCGVITDISGFDSPEIRENSDDLVQQDGGVHGDFFYGRRPVTLTGQIYDSPDAATRNARIDRLQRATNALRAIPGITGGLTTGQNTRAGDSLIYWTPSGGEQVFISCRRSQPLRITGGFVKTFQISMVAEDPRIYSFALNSAVIGHSGPVAPFNYVRNPSFESEPAPTAPPVYWSTSGLSGFINSGASVTSAAGGFTSGSGANYAYFVTDGTATTVQGTRTDLGVLAAGNYIMSVWALPGAAGQTIRLIAGLTSGVGIAAVNVAMTVGAWTRYSLAFNVPTAGSVTVAIADLAGAAGVRVTNFDEVMVTDGSTLTAYHDGDTAGNCWISWQLGRKGLSGAMPATVVVNKGNTTSYPVIQLTTPCDLMVINNDAGGIRQNIVFDSLGGLATLVAHGIKIDTQKHTAFFDDTNIYANLDAAYNTFWGLIPGNNSVSWQSSYWDASNTSMTLYWRDAWM